MMVMRFLCLHPNTQTNCLSMFSIHLMRWWSGVLLRMSGCCWWCCAEPLECPPPAPPELLSVCEWCELRVCEWCELSVCVAWELSVLWAVVAAVDMPPVPCGRDLHGGRNINNNYQKGTHIIETYRMLLCEPFRVNVFICGVPGQVCPSAFI